MYNSNRIIILSYIICMYQQDFIFHRMYTVSCSLLRPDLCCASLPLSISLFPQPPYIKPPFKFLHGHLHFLLHSFHMAIPKCYFTCYSFGYHIFHFECHHYFICFNLDIQQLDLIKPISTAVIFIKFCFH